MFHQLKNDSNFQQMRIQRSLRQQQQQQQSLKIASTTTSPNPSIIKDPNNTTSLLLRHQQQQQLVSLKSSRTHETNQEVVSNGESMEPVIEQLEQKCTNSTTLIEPIIQPFTFVDLGSGDGRVVLYAASQMMKYHIRKEQEENEHYHDDGKEENILLFDACIGYEINPILHLYATIRSFMMQYLFLPYSSQQQAHTQFYLQNIWKVPLHQVDVVAVVR
jgi:hypothetical protein